MGSFCSGTGGLLGGSPQTVAMGSAPSPDVLARYQAILQQAQNVAGTPYQPYSGQFVADLNPTQQSGIANVNAAQGLAAPYFAQGLGALTGGYNTASAGLGYLPQASSLYQQAQGQYGTSNGILGSAAGTMGGALPYFGQGAGLAGAGAQGVSPTQFSGAGLQQYLSPYNQNVIDATLSNINHQNDIQQQGVIGNAIKSGNAFGGDRMGIAMAELARNQDATKNQTIAGLENQNYSQALGEFNQQQGVNLGAQQNNAARELQAAGTMGSLGSGVAGVGQGLGGLAGLSSGVASGLAGLGSQYSNLATTQGSLGGLQAGIGSQIGAFGQGAENTALSGASAQLGAGALAQQTDQAKLAAQYQQFLQQQSYPFQTTQWLSGLTGSLGSLAGGSSLMTNQPAFNPWSTAVGGIGAIGSLLAPSRTSAPDGGPGPSGGSRDGGRIGPGLGALQHFADGGDVDTPSLGILSGKGWIPGINLPMGKGPPAAGQPQAANNSGSSSGSNGILGSLGDAAKLGSSLSSAGKGLGSLFSGSGAAAGDTFIADGAGAFSADAGADVAAAAGGGIMDTLAGFLPFLALAKDGGRIGPGLGALQHFADGGDVDDDLSMPFGDRAIPAQDAIADGIFDPVGTNYTKFGPLSAPSPPLRSAGLGGIGSMPGQAPAGLGALQYADNGAASPRSAGAPQPSGNSGSGFGISDEARAGLLSGFLGMMAGNSPNAFQNIAQGGLKGIEGYAAAQKSSRDQQSIDLRARQLSDEAERHRKQFALDTKKYLEPSGYQREQIQETKRYHDILDAQRRDANMDRLTRSGYVKNPDGTMTPIKGGPADPEHLAAVNKAKASGSLLPDETADFLADRVLAGDTRALVGLGRGAQGAENITRIQTLAAQKAAERGLNPSDILAKVAEQSGLTAQQRTFGAQVARMAVNSTEAEGAIQQGLQVSKQVPRSKFVPVNKLIQMGESSISDPDLLEFRAANLAIINTYARAISPTGTPTVHDKEEAMKVVSEATSPEAYERVASRMLKEIAIAHAAPMKAKQELENIRKGGGSSAAPVTTESAPALGGQGVAPSMTGQDRQALDWATSHPSDPRAAEIKKRLGVQ